MNNFIQIYLIPLLCIFLINVSFSQNTDTEYFDNNYLRYDNHIYIDSIFTVQLHKDGWELSYPLIALNSDDKLKLSFDYLGSESKDFYYTFIHCGSDWTPSNIMQNEYLDGFIDNPVNDYKYSFNTTVKYTNYQIVFPNENVNFKYSGNYIILVYEDYDKSKPVLTRRFSVYENSAYINAFVKRTNIIEERNYSQQIDFKIKYTGLDVNDPFNDIKVILTQNNRWDNALYNIKPQIVRDNELDFYSCKDCYFKGGSEFRNFDIKSIRYQSQYIQSIEYKKPYYHVFLVKDEPRPFKIYFQDRDLNGKFYIKIDEGNDFDAEADYVFVHFTLPYEAPVVDGNIYVFGALSNWKFNLNNQMTYNYDNKSYELSMLLKQGYYNYEYVYVKDGTSFADHTYIEGSHYETENDYIIYVFFRNFTMEYERLLGIKILNSIKDNSPENE